MKSKKKDLRKAALGIAVMFGIYWFYTYVIARYLPIPAGVKSLVSLVVLYGVGLGVFFLVIHKIPTQKQEKRKIAPQSILLCFLLQFTATLVVVLLTVILTALGRNNISTDINPTMPYMLFMLLIFNPIMEELVFRKLFADKLLPYGERFYMLVSAFCFAIVHGVALGIPQVFYTFILGLIWSYLVVKTGDIKLAVLLHALSNLFGSVISQTLMGISMILAGLYSMLMMLVGIVGLILFLIYKKKIVLDGEAGLFRKAVIKEVFTNPGILIYAAFTVAVMILKAVLL